MTDDLWQSVGGLLARAPSDTDLLVHRLGPLAAHLWSRSAPNRVTDVLREAEVHALAMHYAAQRTLRLVRKSYGGEVMVFKGLAAAAHYPGAGLRPFSDVDILADDPEAAHAALIDGGFAPVGYKSEYYDGLHHLRPLRSPLPGSLIVEVHRHVSWVGWSPPPVTKAVLAASDGDLPGVPGVLVPNAAHHALVIAAHSYTTMPLRAVGDLIDVHLLRSAADPELLLALASDLGVSRLWKLYAESAEALLHDHVERLPRWAPGIAAVRDATVRERHWARILAPFRVHEPRDVPIGVWRAVTNLVVPAEGETLKDKMKRALTSMKSASTPLNEHREALGEEARRPRHRRSPKES